MVRKELKSGTDGGPDPLTACIRVDREGFGNDCFVMIFPSSYFIGFVFADRVLVCTGIPSLGMLGVGGAGLLGDHTNNLI